MKTYLSLIFILLLRISLPAQGNLINDGKARAYQGYISGNKSHWSAGIASLKTALRNNPSNHELAYEYLLAEYGKIGYCNTTGDCGDLVSLIEDSQKILKKLMKEKGESSKYSALMAINPPMS
ncbi:MAG: hypothetical protein AAFR87_33865, partial [Bacteroidota bacterium]